MMKLIIISKDAQCLLESLFVMDLSIFISKIFKVTSLGSFSERLLT